MIVILLERVSGYDIVVSELIPIPNVGTFHLVPQSHKIQGGHYICMKNVCHTDV